MFANGDVVGTSTAVAGRMSNSTTLPSIEPTTLAEVSGGVIRSAGGLSSNNLLFSQLPLQLAAINNPNNNPNRDLPLVMAMALAMR